MARGPLFEDDYKHQFSGHETFPLRYGWLKKAFDAVAETEGGEENKSVFLGDDAIARFGVGKNMVASMRHWATATGIIEEPQGSQVIHTAGLGRKLFGPDGLDPYMEHPATLWLCHWQLAALPAKTTWFWAFNHFPAITFDRDGLAKGLERLAKDRAWMRVAGATIKNDVACFVRTYVAQRPTGRSGNDDALESPLTELGLIKAVGKRDNFRFVRGPKSTLGNGVFVYALLDFWSRHSSAATLSFDAIAHEPGGPGRVFLLDENDVADRLAELDDATRGALRWSEATGLRQVVRDARRTVADPISYIDMDYAASARQEAA
ncbi:DUF4007 family protein [Stappia sp. TSB10GB4]|uniref:DUF4007 family protein n=1 Tax=Stappia sp. TSB10GB4 TaxID=2003584 RepID=UPI00164719C4|nr:DUF4007 family protein [Stappia sp. TSB10GB4]